MLDLLQSGNETVIFILFGLVGVIAMVIGYKFGNFTANSHFKVEKKEIEKDSHGLQKSLKRLWEEDKAKLEAEVKTLKNDNHHLTNKLEDYRKKLSGMGVLSFSGSKKRADILYSLLLENEALEQLITDQSQNMINDRQSYLNDRLLDIRKRQRLMAELFNDDTIKNYVQEVLEDDSKLRKASDKVEHMDDVEKLQQETEVKDSPQTLATQENENISGGQEPKPQNV